jgi:hypothetical protein
MRRSALASVTAAAVASALARAAIDFVFMGPH